MKRVLSCVLALLLLAALTPSPRAAGQDVYVTVSVDGRLELAARPVAGDGMTVDQVLREAHRQFYSGGEEGYVSGIDATWNMFMISSVWGVSSTPYVIVNNAPLGSDPAKPSTADAFTVSAGDNIIVAIGSDPAAPVMPVSLTADVADGSAALKATLWTLDFTTFAYTASPFAGARVTDAATGAELGVTDDAGCVTLSAAGTADVAGSAAIPLDGSAKNAVASGAPGGAGDAAGTGQPVTAYVTVSVNGVLQIAAQPVTVTTATVEAALKEAHVRYCPEGLAGFNSGINQQYFMYMIDKFWGVGTTPYVILNGTPLGADVTVPASADTAPLNAGDNIIVNVQTAADIPVVSLEKDKDGYIVAKTWSLDMTTFKYTSVSLNKAEVVDAETGKLLDTSDGTGKVKITDPPDCGVVCIAGLAAIPVGEVREFTVIGDQYIPPAHDYSVFGGPDGRSLMWLVIFGLSLSIPMGIVVVLGQRKELKNRGRKYND